MPCFTCKSRSQYYQRLDRARIRFMRKVYPDFSDSSYLCTRCFEKFERIFKSKKKSKLDSSAISVVSDVTIRTVSSKTSSKSKSTTDDTVPSRRDLSSKENTHSNSSSPLKFFSHSFTNASSDSNSLDSTDRLVQKATQFSFLKDSSKVSRNPDIVAAREGAQAAEKSALRRKRTREGTTQPPQTPAGRPQVRDEDDDDDEEISTEVGSAHDLANVGPIVKRRKERVVYLNPDVMDIYLANTSGG